MKIQRKRTARQWIEGNLRLVQRFFEECWNGGNVTLLDELLAPNHVHHLPGRDLIGSDQVKNLVLSARRAFPDFHITLDDIIIAGNKIVCRWTIQGTNTGSLGSNPPTGKSVVYTGIDIIRCADNRIVELWSQYDSRGLDRQLSQP
ncbi:hypothetical protein ANRL3_00878 [Anaerolineae bacterium]|nr:hypothetical protein ANRL3_00878 [Anaerolineae bacterium]